MNRPHSLRRMSFFSSDRVFNKQRFFAFGTYHRTTRIFLFQDDESDDGGDGEDDDQEEMYGNGVVIKLAKEILDALETKISSDRSNQVFNIIQRMKSDFRNPKVQTYEYMDLDLNMLLAICKASTWFTNKQRNKLFFEDNGVQSENQKLQDENKKLKAELALARQDLSEARKDLAQAKITTADMSERIQTSERIKIAIELLTSLAARLDNNQVKTSSPNFQSPKKR